MSTDKSTDFVAKLLKLELQQSVEETLPDRMLQLLKQLDECQVLGDKMKLPDEDGERGDGQC